MNDRRRSAQAHRQIERRRRVQSALVAGASLLFVPHSGRVAPKPRPGLPTSLLKPAEVRATPQVSVTVAFALPAEIAYEPIIREAASMYELDARLIRAVVRLESGFDATAVSIAGAQGLMQLMPALSEELGVDDPFDPRENLFAGARYLKALLLEHDGDETLALASYNAGPGAVAQHQGVPPYPETQQYVRTITGWLAQERASAND
jgi:soluble lytic murein transglycosylase-like protein